MKRIVTALLVICLLIISFPIYANAKQVEPDGTNASEYLSMYGAYLHSNGTHGKLKVTYQVCATNTYPTVGVYKIIVRNSNGTINQIIWGSTSNGLLVSNNWCHVGEYTLSLVSGNTYYCTVTFIAKDSNGSNTRSITTNSVTCP